MAIGYPLDILLSPIETAALGQVNAALGFTPGQSFQNIPLPNNRLALYTLRLCAPASPNIVVQTYTFPISPSSIIKSYTAMAGMYDVAGTPEQGGVQRIIDQYGNSPLSFIIEGTTGWQRHSTDGYAFTGIESVAAIQQMLNLYAQLNRAQALAGIPDLFSLEFFDYFAEEFWEVVPIGPQTIRQTNNRPLIFEYSFRLAGIKSVASAIVDQLADPIADAFSTTGSQARSALNSSISQTLDNYADTTAGSIITESELQ